MMMGSYGYTYPAMSAPPGVGGTCSACGQEFRVVRLVNGRCPNCRTGGSAPRTPTSKYTSSPATEAALRRHREEDARASAELRAASEGARLGRLHGHDPHRLAKAIGATVAYATMAEIQDAARPDFQRWGYSHKLLHSIVVATDRPQWDVDATLAHEIAHLLNLDAAGGFTGERHCDLFARAFLHLNDDELPGYAHIKLQKEATERERRLVSERARR
jgi:hypothetical protein